MLSYLFEKINKSSFEILTFLFCVSLHLEKLITLFIGKSALAKHSNIIFSLPGVSPNIYILTSINIRIKVI